MAAHSLDYGAVEIYSDQTLGIGSYGKVCKAKCGQLPCAAKLLHETMFGTNDPGINKFVDRFEQECKFLRMIKHPNIVQFLGTSRKLNRLGLLMELMDESLTKFLEQSPAPLAYHHQLNICYDVALALDYLHSNDIVHRDLSSNNVLLLGKGSRAKVTDFGMSKLVGISPHMTPLTMCPGTAAYMPPEALITPPRYSSKLDCFSHGVLTIQIITRQFPDPGDSHVEDVDQGLFKQVPETERRKKDIELVDRDHLLLPLALHCLKTKATNRPTAAEICRRLATLQCDPAYKESLGQPTEQDGSLQALQQQIQRKEVELERARRQIAEQDGSLQALQQQIQRKEVELERARRQIAEKSKELEVSRSNHKSELTACQAKLQKKSEEYKKRLDAKESMLEQVIADCQALVQEKTAECKRNQSIIEQLQKENNEFQKKQRLGQVPRAFFSPVSPIVTY